MNWEVPPTDGTSFETNTWIQTKIPATKDEQGIETTMATTTVGATPLLVREELKPDLIIIDEAATMEERSSSALEVRAVVAATLNRTSILWASVHTCACTNASLPLVRLPSGTTTALQDGHELGSNDFSVMKSWIKALFKITCCAIYYHYTSNFLFRSHFQPDLVLVDEAIARQAPNTILTLSNV
jgi:hypothetical protein